jgi:hypothetical protein
MKVEKLSHYGKTLSDLPEEAMKKQRTIVLAETGGEAGRIKL